MNSYKLKNSRAIKTMGGCFVLFLLLFSFSCRMKTYSKAAEIPAPPETREANVNAEDKIKLLNAMNFIVTRLKEDHAKTDDVIYQIPQNVNWQQMENFYDSSLTKNGWKKSGASERGVDYEIAFWKSNKQTIAAAVINSASAESRDYKFLVVFLAE